MRLPILLVSLLIICPKIDAQPAQAWQKAGDRAFSEEDWLAAQYYYSQALRQKLHHSALWWKLAEARRLSWAYEAAAEAYRRVIQLDAARYPLARLYLADLYRSLAQYDEALAQLDTFLAAGKGGSRWLQRAQQLRIACQWAPQVIAQPDTNWQIRHVGNAINSPYSEFAPWLMGDTLLFSSNRYLWRQDTHQPPRHLAQPYLSVEGARARPLLRPWRKKGTHIAHLMWWPDSAYYTECRYIAGARIRCRIMKRTRDAQGRWHKEAEALPPPINVAGYTSTQPCLVVDTLKKQRWLVFASDRPGGKGLLDLWAAPILGDSIGPARNLSSINTPYNDGTPFFHIPSQTLYFASEGHIGIGGWDIYQVRWPPQADRPPVHLPPPINSTFNDLYFFLSQDGTHAYLASNRIGSRFLDEESQHCCNDLWVLQRHLFEDLLTRTLSADSLNTPPLDSQITAPAPPVVLHDFLPLILYFDNDIPDPRSTSNTTAIAYLQTCDNYLSREATYIAQLTKGLPADTAVQVAKAVHRFFRTEVAHGCTQLEAFSRHLLQRLEQGDTIKLMVRGYASPRAESDYNLQLSARRIHSLRNHFYQWREGALHPFLRRGQLRISELPLGEALSLPHISDRLDNARLSIYSLPAARQRKVVIEEVRE